MTPDEEPVKIVLVDDHQLFRKGIGELIGHFTGYEVVWEANNGQDFVDRMEFEEKPHLVLLDITMPKMDGFETARWLKQNHPDIKVLALSMNDNEDAIIKMLQSGAKGYILKDADPTELKTALHDLMTKGFFYTELVSNTLYRTVTEEASGGNRSSPASLNERELEFLKLACTELTYREIADRMCLSPRTIDGYREALFEKLAVKNRIGLVLYAFKYKIINID